MTSIASGGSVPLVTVIVPTFNCRPTIGTALQSLAEQTSRDFEVVVSDGASRDGTVDEVRALAAMLPALTVLERPDRGVYDAINLGLAQARGEWVLILGGDDRLHAADTLQRAAGVLRSTDAGAVYGDVRMMNPNALGVPVGARHAGPMPLQRLLRANICQQAIFYRRQLFDTLGGFDLRYPVLADWDFNLRVAFHAPMQWIDLVIADYAATGISAQREDDAAQQGIPEFVRGELLRRHAERALWPHHRILLRQADTLRRRGYWRAALRQLAGFVSLMAWRVVDTLRRR